MKTQSVAVAKAANAPLESYLGPGEQVLWHGKPERGPFVFRTWPLSVFGLLLVTSVTLFLIVVLTTEAPDSLAFYAIPFVLAGLYMAVGHFLVTAYEWSHTEYMVTGTRLLIRYGALTSSVTIYSLLGLPHTLVEMHGRDVGNIMFKPQEGQGYGPYPGYQTMWPYTPGYLVGLMYLRNPGQVQQIIESARRGR
jgi:hypothetical protein